MKRASILTVGLCFLALLPTVFTGFVSCTPRNTFKLPGEIQSSLSLPKTVTVIDSMRVLKDSLAVMTADYFIQKDSTRIFRDSVDLLFRSVKYSEFDARFRIARIKKYVAICDYNAVQKKFFFGWIKRAIR